MQNETFTSPEVLKDLGILREQILYSISQLDIKIDNILHIMYDQDQGTEQEDV